MFLGGYIEKRNADGYISNIKFSIVMSNSIYKVCEIFVLNRIKDSISENNLTIRFNIKIHNQLTDKPIMELGRVVVLKDEDKLHIPETLFLQEAEEYIMRYFGSIDIFASHKKNI